MLLKSNIMKKRLEERVNLYSSYLKKTYSGKIARIGLSTGLVCPNRTYGGCIFCDSSTFVSNTLNRDFSITQQINQQISIMNNKFSGYIAYFQDETSTHGETDYLARLYREAEEHESVREIVISTRPDYISEEIIEVIKSLKKKVVIEIGMQSIFNYSLLFLGRNHNFQSTLTCLELLKNHNINVGVHLIIGIPGETEEMIRETIHFISARNEIKFVKFHNLIVYKDTQLERIYNERKADFLTQDDYINLLSSILPFLSKRIIINRFFTSNVNRSGRVINSDYGYKRDWLNKLATVLDKQDIIQGSSLENNNSLN